MNAQRIAELTTLYRDTLLDDVIPWWQSRFVDKEYGGYLVYRDADGALLSTDKPVWVQARGSWIWSRLYNTVEKRADWLETARCGIDFVRKYAFDSDGRMYFSVTRDGRPLRKRRYLFSESFGVIGLAELARALDSAEMLQQARDLYRLMLMYYRTPGLLPPKVIPQTRSLKGHAMPMVLLATSQIMREIDGGEPLYDDTINRSIDELFRDFVRPEKRCLLETVLADGSLLDTPEGRTVNPGHAIETSWFLMSEGRHRQDRRLIDRACEILRWSLEMGWDRQYGGILYFVDCDGKPAEPYEHELKLWWPHCEALYACLLAHYLTGSDEWSAWYERVHEWSFAHFPDRQHGEWFGYLRRDGSVSSPVKGNMWKGPFHLSRTLLYGWQLLSSWQAERTVR